MQSPFLHVLNIGTMATWLSLVGFGAVAWWVHPGRQLPSRVPAEVVVALDPPVFELGEVETASGEPGEVGPGTQEAASVPVSLPLPSPPELAELDPGEPLPEIPELPPMVAPRITKAGPVSSKPPRSNPSDHRRIGGSVGGSAGSGSGQEGSSASSGGGGMSASARLAAGRMPAPVYPREARRKGQQGTVTVEFTIGNDGRVLSARVGRSSGWSSLDSEALRTVRRWKFPPGGLLSTRRPIVFRLR